MRTELPPVQRGRFSAAPYLLNLPGALLLIPFIILPFLGAAWMSLWDWRGAGEATFVGLQNYRDAILSPELRQSFFNTVIYLVATLGLEVSVGLVLALILHAKIPGAKLYQGLFFAPVVLSMTVVGLVWKFVLNPHFGLLNACLRGVGWEGFDQPWLGDARTALLSVCVVSGWKYAGFYMVIFLAALKSIPEEVMEAAQLDGASSMQRAFHVTVPLLRDIWWLCALLCATGAFQTFDLVYVMTGGGPHHATEFVTSWMVQVAFDRLRFGEGCAISVLITLIVLSLAWPYRLLSERLKG